MPRSIEPLASAPPLHILEASSEHPWVNETVEENARLMVNMFAKHLHFFGNQTDIASEGLRGMFVMDEAGAVSKSTIGRAVPWSECGLPDAHHIPLHVQDNYRSVQ